jgi:hypothetical protein
MNVDQKILDRLKALIEMGERVLATQQSPGEMVIGDDLVDTQLAYQWSTSAQNLLARVFGRDSEHYRNFVAQAGTHLTFSPVYHGEGILKAAKDDYENSHLFELRRLLEAEVFDDLLEQAQYLLDSGYYQAAAVVTGCVLEDGLRRLCAARGIGGPAHAKLDAMNANLAKAGAFSALVQKRITALADLRNKAAHGRWTEFTREDVVEMVPAVRRFMEE